MELLGRSNWYMPRWLDKIVPTLGVEVDVDSPQQPTHGSTDPQLDGARPAAVTAPSLG